MEASECAACGRPASRAAAGYSEIPKGTPLCGTCASFRGSGEVMEDIVSRRSAPQPPKSADGVPAEWREHIGKRVQRVDFPSPGFAPGVFEGSCNGGTGAAIRRDDGHVYACPWTALKLLESAAPACWEKPKCSESPLGMHPMIDGVCVYCNRTSEQMRVGGVKLLEVKTPGGSADAATKAEGLSGQGEQAFASAQPPGVASLAAFTAAVNEHLLPRLPEGWSVVTDWTDGDAYVCFVRDEKRQVMSFAWQRDEAFTADSAGECCESIGADVFRISARHQPEPPRTEQSWLDGYLARPASERSGR